MKVLILAAGYGTRLYPLIKDTPKALLAIHGKPIIDYSMDKIANFADLSEVIVVTNNKFVGHLEEWARSHGDFKAPIRIINDGTETPETRLGSIGDIDFVLKTGAVQEDLLVIGGDNVFDYNLDQYLEFSRTKRPSVSIGVFDIHNLEEAKKFGVVAVDSTQKIISFEEKPEQPKSSLIAMCFYYFPQSTLPLLGKYIQDSQKADKAGEYIKWLCARQSVYAYEFKGQWFDIGSIESYHEAQSAFSSNQKGR